MYIGRATPPRSRPPLRKSKSANPFHLRHHVSDGERLEVIERYREWRLNQPDLVEALAELRGKILGCWCAPKSVPRRCAGRTGSHEEHQRPLASLVEGPEPADSIAYTSAGVMWVGPATEPEADDDS